MTDFLKLAAGLSVYNDGRYDGYVIGRVQWLLHGSIQTVESSIMKEKKDYLLLNVNGYGAGLLTHGRLVVTMLKRNLEIPEDRMVLTDADKSSFMPMKESAIEYSSGENEKIFYFDRNQVDIYLKAVRDTNPVHYGERAIVPGLMLLDFILKRESLTGGAKDGTIRFLNPMRVNDRFQIRQDSKELKIVSESGTVDFARMI